MAHARPHFLLGFLTPLARYRIGTYDPRLRFRTISTPRFDIHFHQGRAQARRLAALAKSIAAELDKTLVRQAAAFRLFWSTRTTCRTDGRRPPLRRHRNCRGGAVPRAASSATRTTGCRDAYSRANTHLYRHLVAAKAGSADPEGDGPHAAPLCRSLFADLAVEGLRRSPRGKRDSEAGAIRRSKLSLFRRGCGANRFAPLDIARAAAWSIGRRVGLRHLAPFFHHRAFLGAYGDAALRQLDKRTTRAHPVSWLAHF